MDDKRLELYSRIWLLAIAALHWIVFFLMVSQSSAASTKGAIVATPFARVLASAVASWL
jgi:hypothetical protein